MDFLQVIILSIVEGVSEFLPISSTGHLILASSFLNIPQTEFVKSFEIFIQLGAILAVVVIYWKTLLENKKAWKPLLFAFLPTAIVGFILYKFIKGYLLGNDLVVVLALLIGGILLIILEKVHKEKDSHVETLNNITIKQSILIGLAQSLAVIPGVSRSAATIIGAMFLGIKRKTAVDFAFLLAIPTMLAATALDLFKSNFQFSAYEFSILIVGFVGSFIVALIVVRWFLKFIQKNTFIPFGIYRIIIAILFWVILLR